MFLLPFLVTEDFRVGFSAEKFMLGIKTLLVYMVLSWVCFGEVSHFNFLFRIDFFIPNMFKT